MRNEAFLLKTLVDCARCGGVHHALMFEPLTRPMEDGDGTFWTLWAPCPTNGEPIMLRMEAKHVTDESSTGTNSDSPITD